MEPVSAAALEDLRTSGSDEKPLRLINFWATWCAPCVEEMPDLIALAREYEEAIEFITVSANSPGERPAVMKFLETYTPPGRNLLFAEEDKYRMLKSFDEKWQDTLPFTVLLDRYGNILFRHEGQIERVELKRQIIGALGSMER